MTVSPAVVAASYDSLDDLWQPLELGIAPSGAYVVSLAPEERLPPSRRSSGRRLGALRPTAGACPGSNIGQVSLRRARRATPDQGRSWPMPSRLPSLSRNQAARPPLARLLGY